MTHPQAYDPGYSIIKLVRRMLNILLAQELRSSLSPQKGLLADGDPPPSRGFRHDDGLVALEGIGSRQQCSKDGELDKTVLMDCICMQTNG